MQTFRFFFVIAILALSVGCVPTNRLQVQSSSPLWPASHSTYCWSDESMPVSSGSVLYDNSFYRNTIMQTASEELAAKGYREDGQSSLIVELIVQIDSRQSVASLPEEHTAVENTPELMRSPKMYNYRKIRLGFYVQDMAKQAHVWLATYEFHVASQPGDLHETYRKATRKALETFPTSNYVGEHSAAPKKQ